MFTGKYAFCRNAAFLLVVISVVVNLPLKAPAQIRPVYDTGALGIGQLLKRLNTSASVMMIGAHPDDEDTALLAYLARGENARTAYLSLTRGDGGQNILGPELGEALGVIRTEELLQARKLDGAEQYFTRAYDYGFSKTLDEAKSKWDEEVILCDAVRAIRHFKPLVVISRFSGTPADGHGQHQYAGYISPRAVKAAGEWGTCPGVPWKVRKFYVSQGFRATGEPDLRINTGKYDLLLGRSYFEIAMQARSQHRSQEQGVLELRGEQFSGMNLGAGEITGKGIFEGIETSVIGIAANTSNGESRFRGKLTELQTVISDISRQYDDRSPEKSLPLLAQAYKQAYDAEWSTRIPASKEFARYKQIEIAELIKLIGGIQIDLLTDRETVSPGEDLAATVKVFYPANDKIAVKTIELKPPVGWQPVKTEPAADAQGTFRRETARAVQAYKMKVPADTEPTQPYWLEKPRVGELFEWPRSDVQTLPLSQPLIFADVTMTVEGVDVKYSAPAAYRYADDTRGEIRRRIDVVPKLSVDVDQSLLIVPAGNAEQTRPITVSVTNNSKGPVSGDVSLVLPAGWKSHNVSRRMDLKRPGEKASVRFDVVIPANTPAGTFDLIAGFTVGDEKFARTMTTVDYPHIEPHRFYRQASTKVRVFPLEAANVRIGYIRGSGDSVPEAIRQMGLNVDLLSESDLTTAPLSKWDVIVAGIRVSEVRPDFAANNQRLLDWVRAGGTLIVQYQRPVYAQELTPFPAQIGARVADENAPVTILEPNHPILSSPNKITTEDFTGWVQERNLYSFTLMDQNYLPLLESHDAGEPENKGGLVVANIGKGKYVYCSYAIFRQLPAGVPGAYRLLANMLSLPRTGK